MLSSLGMAVGGQSAPATAAATVAATGSAASAGDGGGGGGGDRPVGADGSANRPAAAGGWPSPPPFAQLNGLAPLPFAVCIACCATNSTSTATIMCYCLLPSDSFVSLYACVLAVALSLSFSLSHSLSLSLSLSHSLTFVVVPVRWPQHLPSLSELQSSLNDASTALHARPTPTPTPTPTASPSASASSSSPRPVSGSDVPLPLPLTLPTPSASAPSPPPPQPLPSSLDALNQSAPALADLTRRLLALLSALSSDVSVAELLAGFDRDSALLNARERERVQQLAGEWSGSGREEDRRSKRKKSENGKESKAKKECIFFV